MSLSSQWSRVYLQSHSQINRSFVVTDYIIILTDYIKHGIDLFCSGGIKRKSEAKW